MRSKPVPDTAKMKPDFAVYLDGTKLNPEEAAAVIGIRVFQTRFGANAFELVVSDPDLKWQGKPTFTECKEVKIELGVPGKLKKVFDGEVTAWRTELERSGPTVIVLRGMDRSHRLMRGHKTKTYQDATPLDVVQAIAGLHGLTAKTRAGSPAPVKMFRFQANESDFDFLRKMADLEGYMFWVDGSDLHFERVELSSTDDCTFTFGENLKTFLPSANFRKSPVSVKVGAWDTDGKAEITGKAASGEGLWTVPGGTPGADKSKFGSTRIEFSIVESKVNTQEHADTVAKAALTRRALEFITAEVEVQGDPNVKPGAMVNLKKVGAYGGHYLITEANHFYDAAGYNVIFYVARDKWGDSSNDGVKDPAGPTDQPGDPTDPTDDPADPTEPADDDKKSFIDFTLQDDEGKPVADRQVKIHLAGGQELEATTDSDGHVHIDEEPDGSYTVEILDLAGALTAIDITLTDAAGNPVKGASGKVTLSDASEIVVMTDARGEVHLTDVPAGEYQFVLDEDADGDDSGGGDNDSGGGEKSGGGKAAAGDNAENAGLASAAPRPIAQRPKIGEHRAPQVPPVIGGHRGTPPQTQPAVHPPSTSVPAPVRPAAHEAGLPEKEFHLDLAWSAATAHCGDKVTLRGTTDLPDGTEVHIELKPAPSGGGVLKLSALGGKIEHEWEAAGIAFFHGDKLQDSVAVEALAKDAKLKGKLSAKIELKPFSTAPAASFAQTRTWGIFQVDARFSQTLDKGVAQVHLNLRVMQGWGGYRVDLSSLGVTGKAGGCDEEGFRWARESSTNANPMTPDEYHDGTGWKKLKAIGFVQGDPDQDSLYTAVAFYAVGAGKFECNGARGTWPEALDPWDFAGGIAKSKRDAWAHDIATRWSHKFVLRRHEAAHEKCCAVPVEVSATFNVVTRYDPKVLLFCRGNLRSNAAIWFLGDPEVQMASHEAGHLLDNPDEYAGGAVDPSLPDGDGLVSGLDHDSIMGMNLTQVKARHLHSFADLLHDAIKTSYGKDYVFEAHKR